jgi:hypothetical protein
LSSVAAHQGWEVVYDDDASCALKLSGLAVSTELQHWFSNSTLSSPALPSGFKDFKGKYRICVASFSCTSTAACVSDYPSNRGPPQRNQMAPCFGSTDRVRVLVLADLDDDVQLLTDFEFVRAYNFTSVVAWFNGNLFQAVLASTAGNPIILRAIEHFDAWVRGRRNVYGLVGPSLLVQALQDLHPQAILNPDARARLRSEGVNLMVELNPSAASAANWWHRNCTDLQRSLRFDCGYAIVAEGLPTHTHDVHVAYSRMVHGQDLDKPLPCLQYTESTRLLK